MALRIIPRKADTDCVQESYASRSLQILRSPLSVKVYVGNNILSY